MESILTDLKEVNLSTTVCEKVVEREKKLKIDIKEMAVIHDLQKVLDFLPRMRQRHANIEQAQQLLDEVRF